MGPFELGNFENITKKKNNSPVSESGTAEFAPNSNATKDVSNGVKDAKIPIPGGDKEQPGDAATTLTSDTYNDVIKALQKSFQEGVEILEMLGNANIINNGSTKNNKKESINMSDMYKEYVTRFIEDGVAGKPLTKEEFIESVMEYIDSDEYTESKKQGSMLTGNTDKSGVGVRRARRTIPKDVQGDIKKGYQAYVNERKSKGKKPELTEADWMGAITQAYRNMYGTDDLSKAKTSDLVNESADFLDDFLSEYIQ